MLITAIESYGSKKAKVFLDNEFAFVLYKGELSKYRITEQGELTEASYQELMDEVLKKRCRLYAMKLLTARPYSKKALKDKLVDAMYPQVLVEDAISYVESFGYINDEQYCADLIDSLSQKDSLPMIRQKLKRKGLSDTVIENCLAEKEEELSQQSDELLISLIRKKTRNGLPSDPIDEAKLYRYLTGKGYSLSQIRKALEIENGRWDDE